MKWFEALRGRIGNLGMSNGSGLIGAMLAIRAKSRQTRVK
jgi:hypothetical protein